MSKVLAVHGPPGTGKTTFLVNHIKDLLKIYDKKEIVFLSHTKAAAKEALSRLDSTGIEVCTIHSLSYRMAGIVRQQVVDWSKLQEFAGKMGFPINGGNLDSEEGIGTGDELLGLYNLAISRRHSFENIFQDSHKPTSWPIFGAFCRGFDSWKVSNGFVDFGDMINLALKSDRQLNFKVLIVDETQDLSPLQWALVRKILPDLERVVVAGDSDQSIYVFGGADPQGFLRFEQEFKAERHVLSQSYRVPAKVHQLSQNLIRNIKNRADIQYRPRTDEQGQVRVFGDFRFLKLKAGQDTLVLYRNHMIRKEIERELLAAAIPFIADSGMPTWFQNRHAQCIRTFEKLKAGGRITPKELDLLEKQSLDRKTAQLFKTRQFASLLHKKWWTIFKIPGFMAEYYRKVDLSQTPTIRIASIHGSKGREADRVILHTGQTQRTIESFNSRPDDEIRVWYVGATRAKHTLDIVEGNKGFALCKLGNYNQLKSGRS